MASKQLLAASFSTGNKIISARLITSYLWLTPRLPALALSLNCHGGFPGRFRVSEEHMEYFSKYPNAFIEQEKKFNKFAQKNYKR